MDVESAAEARTLIAALGDTASFYKVGLELYTSAGMDFVRELKAQGYSIVAVEVAEGARAYQEFEFPVRTCLVLGNEGKGVYPNVLRQCDAAVFIPMAGKGRSVNVAVAAAIVAFRAVLG